MQDRAIGVATHRGVVVLDSATPAGSAGPVAPTLSRPPNDDRVPQEDPPADTGAPSGPSAPPLSGT